VRPSFIFVIRASGSCGCRHSSLEPFFFRFWSSFANSSRVDVSIPLSCGKRVRNSLHSSPVSLRTIERKAALASNVVHPPHRVALQQIPLGENP
jgi:hypothetical protein